MKEQLSLQVRDNAIAARHRFRVFGVPFLELHYHIVRKGQVAIRALVGPQRPHRAFSPKCLSTESRPT